MCVLWSPRSVPVTISVPILLIVLSCFLAADAQYQPPPPQQQDQQQQPPQRYNVQPLPQRHASNDRYPPPQQAQQQQQHQLQQGSAPLTQSGHVQAQQYNVQQYSQQQRNLQQRGYQQNAENSKSKSLPTGFINSPVSTGNGSANAVMQIRLVSYTNPSLSLPHGKTCVCPPGKACAFLQPGIPSCMFSFSTIVSAPDQSVQYISSEFMPVIGPTLSAGSWTDKHTVNLTSRPTAIDVFVNHLGVVIDRGDAQLELYNYLINVDTFVVSLTDYDASQGNTVAKTTKGLLQGTSLQLEYSIKCSEGRLGPSCDLTCKPSESDPTTASCVSATTGVVSSCQYTGVQVTNCNACVNGVDPTGTECLTTSTPSSLGLNGVSTAYRIWTIVLGCLLGLSVIFIILLIICYVIARNRAVADAKRREQTASTNPYRYPAAQPLIRKDDEWNREPTRATSNFNASPRNESPSDDSFTRGNSATAASRREAQV